MARGIPDRWIPYFAYGKVIEGTRLICFKVPLKRTVQAHKPEITQIWDVKTLLETIPKLGAVIDLTNTSRYYKPEELKSAGVLHKKILMPGRIIPPEDKVTEFMDTVEEFLQKDDESLVGVHCTHGLNRTGYMVCRYLRDRMRWPAAVAIDEFEKARGYQIERENYKADLLGKDPPSPDINRPTTIIPINAVPSMSDSRVYKRKTSRTSNRVENWRDRSNDQDDKKTDHWKNRNKDDWRSKRGRTSNDSLQYRSPLATHEEEVDGHTMRYGARLGGKSRINSNKYFKNKRKDSVSSSESYDYRYDY